jgi:hypothetical protein
VLKTAQSLLVVALLWGAVAFGAVYPWAYWPLAAASVLVFACAIGSSTAPRSVPPAALIAALCVLGVAIALQLVPLPVGVLAAISPGTMRALEQLDPAVAAHLAKSHSISLDPAQTLRGLALFGADCLLTIGCARLFSVRGSRGVAEALTAIAVALALDGIVQQALFNGKIYGFWSSLEGGDPYGPFVNRNHFAGWMLMALPVTLGLLCGRMARGLSGVKPAWRDRVLWLSSPDASRLVLLAASSTNGARAGFDDVASASALCRVDSRHRFVRGVAVARRAWGPDTRLLAALVVVVVGS